MAPLIMGPGDKGYFRVIVRNPIGGLNTAETWFISKRESHVENGLLVADSSRAARLFSTLPRAPRRVRGNLFRAKRRY